MHFLCSTDVYCNMFVVFLIWCVLCIVNLTEFISNKDKRCPGNIGSPSPSDVALHSRRMAFSNIPL